MNRAVTLGTAIFVAALESAASGQLPRTGGTRPGGPRPPTAETEERRAALARALAEDPSDVKRYYALAEFYDEQDQPGTADMLLERALPFEANATLIFEKRLALWVKPVVPRELGRLALEWLTFDGTNPVPALLASGHYLRQASAHRGDGTRRSEEDVEAGLRIVDGAMPANPDVPALLLARSNLLLAQSALVTAAMKQQALIEEAQALYQHGAELAKDAKPFTGAAASALSAMLQMPPFGPPGAIRVPSAIASAPKKITNVLPAHRDLPRGVPSRTVMLELVVDPGGKVVQIHNLESVEGYDDAVAEAVKQWVYEPTVVNGQAKTVILTAGVQTR